tara:strand:- start:428 stop:1027 length:600 start_codon:yes stop_codon:yes gene_type:complete
MSAAPAPSWLKIAAISALIGTAVWAAVEAPTVYGPANAAGLRDVCAKLDCAFYPSPKGHPMSDYPTGETPRKETEADKAVRDSAFRMLTPRERLNAQDLPQDDVIDGHWQETDCAREFHPFTKDVQISCCGNSVFPPIAEALVSANCSDLKKRSRRHASKTSDCSKRRQRAKNAGPYSKRVQAIGCVRRPPSPGQDRPF